jgi:hypothetical protein
MFVRLEQMERPHQRTMHVAAGHERGALTFDLACLYAHTPDHGHRTLSVRKIAGWDLQLTRTRIWGVLSPWWGLMPLRR